MRRGVFSSLLLACLFLATATVGRGDLPAASADETKEARKAFHEALKTEDWQARREAYLGIADYDGAAVVEEVLDAMVREANPAVVLTGIGVLAGFQAADAQDALAHQLRKGKRDRRTFALLALARQRGDRAVPLLLETLAGKDAPAAAQAALALGNKGVQDALPKLLDLLAHKDWHLRVAAARAIRRLATPPPPKPKPGEENKPPAKMPVPDWVKTEAVGQSLLRGLKLARGRDRGAIVEALAAVYERDLGDNAAAWAMVVAGEEPDDRTLRKRVYPPYAFGIPIYGRRVVFVIDNSLRSGDPHRFGSGDRLLELCKVPGGFDILGMRLRTVGQFAAAHYKRCINDLSGDVKFELISFNETVQNLFGRLSTAGSGNKRLAQETLDGLKPDNGIATYDALTAALDIAGSKDSAAWKKGPDEIIFMTCNMPTTGELKHADVVAAAIAMKARLRLVTIHTIGIESHPYDMLRTIAQETGGVYRNYYE